MDISPSNIPIWLVVHGHHRVALEDAVLRRKVALGEGLAAVSFPALLWRNFQGMAYVLIVLVSDLLAGELLEPLLGLVAAVGLQAWNDERHLC